MTTEPDDPGDFSPRRGCVRAPLLVLLLLAIIAGLFLVGQYRFPFPGNPPPPGASATKP